MVIVSDYVCIAEQCKTERSKVVNEGKGCEMARSRGIMVGKSDEDMQRIAA